MASPPLCITCSKPGSVCASYHDAVYCGKDRQKADWQVHKLVCKSFAQLGERPSPMHFRSIYFPPDHHKPVFRWLKVSLHVDEHEGPCHRPHLDFIHQDPWMVDLKNIQYDDVLKQNLSHTVCFASRDNFRNDGSMVNMSINNATTWAALPNTYEWAGLVVAFGLKGVDTEAPRMCDDLGTADLRSLADYFYAYDEARTLAQRGSYKEVGRRLDVEKMMTREQFAAMGFTNMSLG
ncbi:hypothetical protein LTR17_017637 [Elasticomyces elasticus]|nr:hypothetical protein LTR17_017637 [Elasticomyces elasticus]